METSHIDGFVAMTRRVPDTRDLTGLPERIGTLHEVPADHRLFTQGAQPDAVYLIRDGIVKYLWTDAHGGEVIVGLRWPGALIGSASAVVGLPHSTTAATLTRCLVEHIGRGLFLERLAADPRFSMYVLRPTAATSSSR